MSVRKLTYGGLLVALAIILPSMFHLVVLGSVFLPMHIPVLFSGFVCGPVIGMLVGMMSPILSSVITGMPPLVPPIAQGMVVELALYGLLTGVLYERLRLGAYISLAGAMISGRIAYGVMGYLVLPMFGFAKTPIWAPLLGAFGTSLPGVLIQLVCIPPALSLMKRDIKVLLPAKRGAQ